jgi:hypothetical protein
MVKHFLYAVVFVFIYCQQAYPQEIQLKNSFWSGWKYSLDGVKYEKVGISAKPLKEIMADCDECVKKLETYETGNIIGIALAIPTLTLIAVNIIEMTDGDGKDPSLGMNLLTLAIGGAGIGAFSAAEANLKDAVEMYNYGNYRIGLLFALQEYETEIDGRLNIVFTLSF